MVCGPVSTETSGQVDSLLGQVSFGERLSLSVLRADGWRYPIERPCDSERRIVPPDAAFAGRVVEVSGLVEHFCGIGKDQETMGKSLRNPQHFQITVHRARFQVEDSVAAKVRRIAAEIDGDVQNVPVEYTHQLSLRLAQLVVQTAQDAARRKRLIILHKVGGEASGGKFLSIEDLGKPPAFIAEAAGPDDFDVTQRSIKDLHPSMVAEWNIPKLGLSRKVRDFFPVSKEVRYLKETILRYSWPSKAEPPCGTVNSPSLNDIDA